MRKKIGIIGAGNMGKALIKGLHKSHTLTVVDPNEPTRFYLKEEYKDKVNVSEILDPGLHADIIILAVKPQDMESVLKNLQPSKNQVFISIAAGLTTKYFEKYLGKIRVIRCMPNMPALIGEGIAGICAGKYASATDLKEAQKILSAIGQTVIVKESMIDAVTAVSGSGPAYVFLFVEQWMAAAKKLGFKESEAKELVYKTLLGSAHLLEKSTFSAGELRVKVTSKGGTTQAALDVFSKMKFDQIMKDALVAAKKRAKELAK